MARSRLAAVNVKGLPQLQRALKEIDAELVGELRDANQRVAERAGEWAAQLMRARGGRLGAKIAPSIKGRRDGRHAVISLGGARPKVYQAAWALEFGAKRPRYNFGGRHPWVGNQYERPLGDDVQGHYVAKVTRERAEDLLDVWAAELEPLLARAFPDR